MKHGNGDNDESSKGLRGERQKRGQAVAGLQQGGGFDKRFLKHGAPHAGKIAIGAFRRGMRYAMLDTAGAWGVPARCRPGVKQIPFGDDKQKC